MIHYNPKNWFGLIFQLHKSDTFRQLFGIMVLLGIYSWLVAYIEIEVWQLKFKSTSIIHSLLGLVLSLLLVFRTNTAYDRWWEGRKLWGSLLNNSRNLAIKLNAYVDLDDHQSRKMFHELISNYASSLRLHLEKKLGKQEDAVKESEPAHIPNAIAKKLFYELNQLHTKGKINGEQLIIASNEVQSFTDICGACERIKKTPIPFSYSLFIKKFVFIYIMTMPFCFVQDLGYWIILTSVFVFYVLVSTELIAEEIEDPFGGDANDLPLHDIATNIHNSVKEILVDPA